MKSTINETIEKILADPSDNTPLDDVLAIMENQFRANPCIAMEPATIPVDVASGITINPNTDSVVSPMIDTTRIRPAKDININLATACTGSPWRLDELTRNG